MTTTQTIALIAVTIWLSVLSVVTLVSLRLVALCDMKLRELNATNFLSPSLGTSILAAAPSLGSRLDIDTTLQDVMTPNASCSIVFLSGTCLQCRLVATAIARSFAPTRSLSQSDMQYVVVAAGAQDLVDELVGSFDGLLPIVRDPEASAIARRLGISTMPFVLELDESGTVTRSEPVVNSDSFRDRLELQLAIQSASTR
ncbi:MAG: hypothetical protein ABI658_23430 [Acidimicrobiales bacterium]